MAVISFGYQGLGNIGDDLMHLCILKKYKSVFILRGRRLRNADREVSMPIYLFKIIFSRKLIFTGGNIFSVETKKSYLKLGLFLILTKIRKLLKVETEFYSIGLNREIPVIAKLMTIQILRSASYIHVRDQYSYAFTKENGINSNLLPDVVLTCHLDCFESLQSVNASKPYLVYFPSAPGQREGKRIGHNFQVHNNIFQGREGYSIIQSAEDECLAAENFPNSKIIRYHFNDLNDVLKIIQSADMIVTERLHGAILAERFKVPYLKSNNTEKLKNIFLP